MNEGLGSTPILSAAGLDAGYGSVAVVRQLDLHVNQGEVVALLGPNGAGKTTALLTLAGELKPLAGVASCVRHAGSSGLHRRARSGLSFVTEERSTFSALTVAENLRVGRVEPAAACEYFPELAPLMKRKAGLLSGGEQQMLSLARALARRPKVLLADELSLGLAPLVVERLLQAVRAAADEGVAVLLVEQHSRKALAVADRAYLMQRGRVVLTGTAAEFQNKMSQIDDMYLSGGQTQAITSEGDE